MGIFKKIDNTRRKVMRRLAKNIGTSQANKPIKLDGKKIEIKRVLISRPNDRLGNLLLITPLLQEVIATFPDCKIDMFVRGGLAPALFKNYQNVDQIINLPRKPFKELLKYMLVWVTVKKHRYDIAINVVKYSSSGRLSCQVATSRFKFFGDDDDMDTQTVGTDYQHIAKQPVYSFRNYVTKLGFAKSNAPVPPLNLKLTEEELAHGKAIVDGLVHDPTKKTICLFTYATGRKCYSTEWWSAFYGKLKTEFPDYNFLEVLPKENVSQINFVEPAFDSGNVRHIGAVIKNTAIFIGADSGIMHLASAAGATTVGLFHYTNTKIYEPYNGNSVAIDTNFGTVEDWVDVVRERLA
jgi:heptosyltransferase-3